MIDGHGDYFPAALELLERYYGYESFRPAQEKPIKSILSGRDTLAIMPTGAGKSLCFQIPALIFSGLTIVISPLISLMKDQVDALNEQGVNATFINSTLTPTEARERKELVISGMVKILYVAPERLDTPFFSSLTEQVPIAMVAVDEAHCISQWGHDFRPSYKEIAPFIARLPTRPVVSAFTATATPEVRDDIVVLLRLSNPVLHVSGFDRPNLYFGVLQDLDRDEFIVEYCHRHRKDSGIIYAATRKDVERLAKLLQKSGIAAGAYHAGMADNDRADTQDGFIYDRLQVVVATNAFGMGIDKSNVRYVLHYNMPKNIEAYYQEAGRAGRDGEPGECLLLFSPGDIAKQKYLINHSTDNQERQEYNLASLRRMTEYCESSGCLRQFILRYFGEAKAPECHNCSNCRTEREEMDVTEDAQKVFSCIYRMGQRFGVSMVADVLKGANNQRVKQLGFDRLSTYGLFRNFRLHDIRRMIDRFVAGGYLAVSGSEYPVLRLRESAVAVLRGQVRVQVLLPKKPSKVRAVQSKEAEKVKDTLPARNIALFEKLRELRKAIAQRDHLPPYMIFSDATLKDMCTRHPRSLQELRRVKGVGDMKLAKYGDEFLSCLLAN